MESAKNADVTITAGVVESGVRGRVPVSTVVTRWTQMSRTTKINLAVLAWAVVAGVPLFILSGHRWALSASRCTSE